MRSIITALLLIQAISGFAQASPSSISAYPLASDSSASLYFAAQRESAAIYNGRVFYGYPVGTKGFPYFPGEGWEKGSVLYDGTWFHEVTLRYDAFLEEVITLHPSSTPVRLLSERVQEFRYNGIQFVQLQPDSANVLKKGFYQQLVSGPVSVFATRQRKIDENIVDLAVERKFISADQFYIKKDGKFYHVDKQKKMLSLMKDSRENVGPYLKQRGLKFKNDREKTLVEAAKFYNQSRN